MRIGQARARKKLINFLRQPLPKIPPHCLERDLNSEWIVIL